MKPPIKKYQVFVSATRDDLLEERGEVFLAVMKARHIPVGMELFTANSDRGWKVIQRMIDTTDYYVIVVAGRYGSIDPETGLSWTEREYQYAIDRNITVLAFIRNDRSITADKLDDGPDKHIKQAKLQALKNHLRDTHLCVPWDQAEDLAAAVSDGLRNHIDDDESEGIAPTGWVRGGDMLRTASELARLSEENRDLRARVAAFEIGRVELQFALRNVASEDGNEGGLIELDGRELEMPRTLFRYQRPAPQRAFGIDLGDLYTGGPSHEDYESWVDKVNRSTPIQLSVANTGKRKATDVVVKIHIAPANDISRDVDPPTRFPNVSPISHPSQNVYIESIRVVDDGSASVLVRIRNIAPGLYAEIDDLYVLLPDPETPVVVQATATDGEGDSVSVRFEIVNRVEGSKVFSIDEP